MRKCIVLCFLLVCALCAQSAMLGKLSLDSGLNEPFKADIEILPSPNGEQANLRADNSVSEQGYLIGDTLLENPTIRIDILNKTSGVKEISAMLTQADNGLQILHLTSAAPITDEYLEFIVTLTDHDIQLAREYMVLFDPSTVNSSTENATSKAVKHQASDTVAVGIDQPAKKLPVTDVLSKKSKETATPHATDAVSKVSPAPQSDMVSPVSPPPATSHPPSAPVSPSMSPPASITPPASPPPASQHGHISWWWWLVVVVVFISLWLFRRWRRARSLYY